MPNQMPACTLTNKLAVTCFVIYKVAIYPTHIRTYLHFGIKK